jgi:hypothetical protein
MIDPAINTGWFEIFEATNKSATWRPSVIRNTRDSPDIVNTFYRTTSSNKCIQVCYNQNPKMQKVFVSERVNIRRITPFNQKPN